MAGVLWNPIIYTTVSDEYNGGTYVSNCKANNVTIHAPNAQAASILATADEAYIYNCLSTNCSIESDQVSGAIIAEGKGEMSNCYYYNYSMTGNKKEQYDETAATA